MSGKQASQHTKASKPGIIYLNRLPPGLDVTTVRSLLSSIGPTNRIWLRPEPHATKQARKTLGHTRRSTTTFRDGWVEFQSRRHARAAIALLHARPIRARARKGRWTNDLWCMRYLRGFAWSDLHAESFGNARERTQRVRRGVGEARREVDWVMSRARGRGGVVKGERGASCRRFGQRAVLNEGDAEEERARMAGERVVAVGEGDDMGKKEVIDKHLVRLLFQRGAKVAH